MDRNKFEDLIIDYLDDNLSAKEKADFEEALAASEEYRELLGQYQSIRFVTSKDNEINPSGDVIDRISRQVNQSANKERESFVRRLVKFSLFAPVLAAAIIAMLWFSAGEDYLRNKNIIPPVENAGRDESRSEYKANAGKLTQKKRAVEEEAVIPAKTDAIKAARKNINGSEAPLSKPSAPAEDNKGKMQKESISSGQTVEKEVNKNREADFSKEANDQKTDVTNGDIESEIVLEDKVSGKNESFEDEEISSALLKSKVPEPGGLTEETKAPKDQDDRSAENDTMMESYSKTASVNEPIKPGRRVEIMNGYRNELNEIVTMQYSGDCRGTLERSQKLLDSDPEPSVSIKTDLYLTQGECYTELGQYDKALEVYEKAKELTPHKSYFFNAKIKEVYLKQNK